MVPRHGTTEITLEHLARHTSGLPRSPTPFTLTSGSPSSRAGTRTPTWTRTPYWTRWPSSDCGAPRGPGRGAYSNFGAGLLGIALRRMCRSRLLRRAGRADGAAAARAGRHRGPAEAEQSARLARARPVSADRSPTGIWRVWPARARCGPPCRTCSATCGPSWTRTRPAGRGDPADPPAAAARPPAHVRAGLDAHPAVGWRPVVAQRRHRRVPQLRRVQPAAAAGGRGAGQQHAGPGPGRNERAPVSYP